MGVIFIYGNLEVVFIYGNLEVVVIYLGLEKGMMSFPILLFDVYIKASICNSEYRWISITLSVLASFSLFPCVLGLEHKILTYQRGDQPLCHLQDQGLKDLVSLGF